MEKNIGKSCPICNEQFVENDNIVVCPDCGTPHHRDCYAKNGACAYENRHDSMRIEEQIGKENEQQAPGSQKNSSCYQCGMENPPDALFCNYCGAMMSGEQRQSNQNNQGKTPNQPFNKVFFNTAFSGMKPDDKIGDISVKDFVVFLGPRANYYLPKFKDFSENKPISFNLSAFLFPGFYFLYRKMISYSIIFWVLSFISSALFLLWNFNSNFEPFLSAATANFVNSAYTVVWYVDFAIRLISFFFANRLYYRFAVKTINKCRALAGNNPQEYISLLNKKGTVSVAYVGIGFLAVTLFTVGAFYLGLFLFS